MPSTYPPNNFPGSLPSPEMQIKKNQRTRATIIAIVLTLAGLTGMEVYLLQKQTTAPISNNLVVLTLFNFILILLFLLVILITRNLVKLYNERKSKIIGSKFQTKLIIAFLILALVPSILLFIVASQLFSYSIGNWFNIQIEQTLKHSMDIAREHYLHVEKAGVNQTKKIEEFITRGKLYLKENRSQLHNLIKNKVYEYDLGGIIIFDNNKEPVLSEVNKTLLPDGIDFDMHDLIQRSGDGTSIPEYQSTNWGNFLIVMVPLTQTVDGKMSVWGYIVSLTHFPRSIHLKIATIRNTVEDYKRQSFLKLPVSASYYFTFLLITLLILFSAIWLGFYFAKGITVPIQQLAEGTRRISEGDLNFNIGVQATDEIGMLVESFNQMTWELNESRQKVQRAHEDLTLTNIELESRRNYIATILDNIGAGVVSVDKRGHVTTFNKAAESILNVEAEDVFGYSYRESLDPAFHEPVRKMIRWMNDQNKEFHEEQVDIRVGESNLSLLVNIQVLKDPSRKYMGLVIVFEDLTQMIKAQKIAAWKEVAQGIAHEIKNPLTPIQLNTQRLKKKYYEDKKAFGEVFDESINIISQEVEGMKELLNEFLRFSRMPTANPRPTPLHKLIDDVAHMYKDHEKIKIIRRNFDPNISLLNIDPEQIRRVFINLFENSIDALEEVGEIEIHTRLT
ncbi:MAG: PAS domain-containing sensor histidine kinase, partial [Nitrospinae bacterium CG11_big_fil_rev_8_21_14_0_20_56_8]